ncbi:MAG: DUF58 domain-containing protein [Chloroflexota bacterium]
MATATSASAPEGRASAPERVLQRIDWQVVRRLDGLLQGDYRSLFLGSGVDLAGLREYQVADDVRYIDWNVTARMGVPYVRLYHEDRDITGWFLVDLSPSVDFGTAPGGRDKRAAIIDLVIALARVLQRHGNRVGAILYADRVATPIPARGGRDQVLRIVDALLDAPRLPRANPRTSRRSSSRRRPRCGDGRWWSWSRTSSAGRAGSSRWRCSPDGMRCSPSASMTRGRPGCPMSGRS